MAELTQEQLERAKKSITCLVFAIDDEKILHDVESNMRGLITHIEALTQRLADAESAIRMQSERYQAQCENEDKLEDKCKQLEDEKRDCEAAQRERCVVAYRKYFSPYAITHSFLPVDECLNAIRQA